MVGKFRLSFMLLTAVALALSMLPASSAGTPSSSNLLRHEEAEGKLVVNATTSSTLTTRSAPTKDVHRDLGYFPALLNDDFSVMQKIYGFEAASIDPLSLNFALFLWFGGYLAEYLDALIFPSDLFTILVPTAFDSLFDPEDDMAIPQFVAYTDEPFMFDYHLIGFALIYITSPARDFDNSGADVGIENFVPMLSTEPEYSTMDDGGATIIDASDPAAVTASHEQYNGDILEISAPLTPLSFFDKTIFDVMADMGLGDWATAIENATPVEDFPAYLFAPLTVILPSKAAYDRVSSLFPDDEAKKNAFDALVVPYIFPIVSAYEFPAILFSIGDTTISVESVGRKGDPFLETRFNKFAKAEQSNQLMSNGVYYITDHMVLVQQEHHPSILEVIKGETPASKPADAHGILPQYGQFFTTFKDLLNVAEETFNDASKFYVVFAPTNDAFTASYPTGARAVLDAALGGDVAVARSIVNRHIVALDKSDEEEEIPVLTGQASVFLGHTYSPRNDFCECPCSCDPGFDFGFDLFPLIYPLDFVQFYDYTTLAGTDLVVGIDIGFGHSYVVDVTDNIGSSIAVPDLQGSNGYLHGIETVLMDPATFSPTSGPTSSPSTPPTSMPTSRPSTPPTSMPTTSPSSMPTSMPTTDPSSMPTSRPSTPPTSMPTTSPSSMPTSRPSTPPTSMPTTNPSSMPTSMPTTDPSSMPTSMPTTDPSSMPTSMPTTDPSSMPTSMPSTRPTSSPSRPPTSAPSATPTTAMPSRPPTNSPTYAPNITERPSLTPNTEPPSRSPTSSPTTDPTTTPTTSPTLSPSLAPSLSPTDGPTTKPSRKPTDGPTTEPSRKPSDGPTTEPSRKPSDGPTTKPSDQPIGPTSNPTTDPSSAPSKPPTSSPTSNPTLSPSMSPTGTVLVSQFFEDVMTVMTGNTNPMGDAAEEVVEDFKKSFCDRIINQASTVECIIQETTIVSSRRRRLQEDQGTVTATADVCITYRAVGFFVGATQQCVPAPDATVVTATPESKVAATELITAAELIPIQTTEERNEFLEELQQSESEVVRQFFQQVQEVQEVELPPTQVPTLAPTPVPTFSPIVSATARPTRSPIAATARPTSTPSEQPVTPKGEGPSTADAVTSVPTTAPITAVPTETPETEPPTPKPYKCEDTTRQVRLFRKKQKKRPRDCEWLRNQKNQTRRWYCANAYNQKDKPVNELCRETCGNCKDGKSSCSDSDEEFIYWQHFYVRCDFFTSNKKSERSHDETRRAVHCLPDSPAKKLCPRSCDNCKFAKQLKKKLRERKKQN